MLQKPLAFDLNLNDYMRLRFCTKCNVIAEYKKSLNLILNFNLTGQNLTKIFKQHLDLSQQSFLLDQINIIGSMLFIGGQSDISQYTLSNVVLFLQLIFRVQFYS